VTTYPKQFVIYKDTKGEWRWQLLAANNKIIADSAEGYVNKADCKHGASLVASIAIGAAFWNRDTQAWE
jgi:uncharacterized protein YegP (UPF0339 family)